MTAPRLIFMCGVSFAGKSTVAAALAGLVSAEVVSLDAINEERGLDGGAGLPVEEWIATYGIAQERVAALLLGGQSVIVDDTTSLRMLRDGWRRLAEEHGAASALVWVRIDPDLQRERVVANRATRARPDVIDEVLAELAEAFEPPSDSECPVVVDARGSGDPAVLGRVLAEIEAASAPR